MAILGNPISVGGGGESKLNLFVQTSTPTSKEGIWLKTSANQTVNAVVVDNKFYNTGTYSNSGFTPKCDLYYTGQYARSIAVGNYVYTFGQRATTSSSSPTTCNVLIFDVINGTTTTASMSSYTMCNCIGLDYDGSNIIYAAFMTATTSGSNNARKLTIYKFTISTNTCSLVGSVSLDTYTNLTSAVRVGDIIYAYGYNENYAYTATYDLSTLTGNADKNTGKYFSDASRSHERHFMISDVEYAYGTTYYESSYIRYTIYRVTRDGSKITYTAINSFNQKDLFSNTSSSSYIDLRNMTGYGDYLYFSTFASDGGLYRMDLKSGTVTKVTSITESAKATIQLVYSASLGRIIAYRDDEYTAYMYYLTPKQYATNGTFIILKSDNQNGAYYTELVPYKETVTGDYTRFCTGFNDAYFYKDNAIMSASLYYGNGTSWVQIR